MKKRDLYNYLRAMDTVKDLKGVRFAYSILKNKKKIEEEIQIFEEVIKPNPLFAEYERNRITLCEMHSEKDTEGKPIIIGDKYKLIDTTLFNTELDKLKSGYQDVIEERIKQINEYNEILEEEVDIDLIKLNINELPSEITPKQLEFINFMVNMN